MLIDKGHKTGDIISIKLTTGEELIARFEAENNESIKVDRPLLITLGGNGLGMIPWMFLAEKDSFNIQKLHILATALTKKEAADQYMQGTTGIALR